MKFEGILPYNEGIAAAKVNGKWMFIDINGNQLFDTYFDSVTNFFDNLAMVCKSNACGFIDSTGKMVISYNPKYYDGYVFKGDYAIMLTRDIKDDIFKNTEYEYNWVVIDKSGKEIIQISGGRPDIIENKYIGCWGENDVVLELATKKIIWNGRYESCGDFLIVSKTGKCGIFDLEKRLLTTSCTYSRLSSIWNYRTNNYTNYFIAELNGKYGVINNIGQVIVEIIYDRIETVFDFETDEFMIYAEKFKKCGVIDIKNNVIVDFIYDGFITNNQGFVFQFLKNNVLFLLDKKGKVILTFADERPSISLSFEDNRILILATYIDWHNLTSRSTYYEVNGVKSEKSDLDLIVLNDEHTLYGFKVGKKYGIKNHKLEVIAPPIFDEVGKKYASGYLPVFTGSEYYFIDENGKRQDAEDTETQYFNEHVGKKSTIKSEISKEKFIKYLISMNEEKILEYANKGGNINFLIDGEDNVSPVSFLIQKNRIDLAKKLIKKGANLSIGLPLLELTVLEDYTLEDVKFLVEKGAIINEKGVKDFFPLWNIAYDNRLEIAQFLFSKGVDINQVTKHGRNVIFNAVQNSEKFNPKFLKWLIEIGIDPYLKDNKGDNFMSIFEKGLYKTSKTDFILRSCGAFEFVNHMISKDEFLSRLSDKRWD